MKTQQRILGFDMQTLRDIASYIGECGRKTLQIRERGKAMMALIGGILALPVVWALGGKLEPTEAGIFWFAVWLTVSSLLTLFAVAPFAVWRELRANRMSDEKLDEISRIRERMINLMGEMISDPKCAKGADFYKQSVLTLEEKAKTTIADYAGMAEANAYSPRGALYRHAFDGEPPHQVWIDIMMQDQDYLRDLIRDYSRGRKRPIDAMR